MSVNKVILLGYVGKDPDVRVFDNGSKVVNFSLATTEKGYTSKEGKVVPDSTEWHNILVWRGLAKIAEQYVKKGSQLYIEGKMKTRSYDDQQGVKRYVVEVYADQLQLLGSKDTNITPSQTSTPSPAPSLPTDETDNLPF